MQNYYLNFIKKCDYIYSWEESRRSKHFYTAISLQMTVTNISHKSCFSLDEHPTHPHKNCDKASTARGPHVCYKYVQFLIKCKHLQRQLEYDTMKNWIIKDKLVNIQGLAGIAWHNLRKLIQLECSNPLHRNRRWSDQPHQSRCWGKCV